MHGGGDRDAGARNEGGMKADNATIGPEEALPECEITQGTADETSEVMF